MLPSAVRLTTERSPKARWVVMWCMHINHLSRATAAAATVALILTGCGGAGGGGEGAGGIAPQAVSAEQALRELGEQLDSMKSWRFTVESSGVVNVKGQGAYQVSPLAMEISLDKAEFSGQSAKGGMRMRVVDSTIYLSVGDVAALGGRWIKMPAGESGQFGDLLNDLGRQDPRIHIRLFASATGVTKVGTETIDGTVLTHYTVTLDPRTVGTVAGLSAQELQTAKDSFAAAGTDSVEYDVWVDGSFRPRQIKAAMPGSGGGITMTMRITDINSSVKINAPASKDIVELPAG